MISETITERNQQFTCTLLARGKARFNHGPRAGKFARFALVEVFNPATSGRYQVRVVQGQTVPECGCPHYAHRLSAEGRTACKHGLAAARFLKGLAEATPAPAAVSPAIIGQIEDPHAEARRDAERLWPKD
jgi:hypothetical protein